MVLLWLNPLKNDPKVCNIFIFGDIEAEMLSSWRRLRKARLPAVLKHKKEENERLQENQVNRESGPHSF